MNKKELRYLRLKNNLTQRQMCRILGISCDRYSRIERGYTVPTKSEFEKIAKFFGTGESEWQM
ncbi:helix-turn-helix domain-containing protein [Cloacibacillus evryensis]|uniref:helix-turn-helix domain-containing protein n=1 Tax=Cloacibacillus evryensis TaxID=508460 RepID=UPI0034A0580B